jgi:hypothetical protein
LRFGRHNSRAQPSKRRNAIADVRPYVKYEIPGLHEAAVEPIHSRRTGAIAIVDVK